MHCDNDSGRAQSSSAYLQEETLAGASGLAVQRGAARRARSRKGTHFNDRPGPARTGSLFQKLMSPHGCGWRSGETSNKPKATRRSGAHKRAARGRCSRADAKAPAGLAVKRLPQSLQASLEVTKRVSTGRHGRAARLKRLLRERVPHNPQEPRVLLSATGAPTRVPAPLLALLDALKKLRAAQCSTRGG